MAAIKLEKKQERIVTTLEGPLFVSAGAGSGKTFTLTQRVLHALRPGSKPRAQWADPQVPEAFLDSIDQVLAITFTTKAAEELKERIRAALVAEGMEREAAKVDSAWISTIHGMCSRIIRAHALDLGIDPAFTVIDDAEDLRRLAVEHVLRGVAAEEAQGEGAFRELVEAFALEGTGSSRALDSLMAILTAVLGKASSSVKGMDAFEQVPPSASPRELYDAYDEIAGAPSYANAEAAAGAMAALNGYLASERTLSDLRALADGCPKLSKRGRGMGKDEKAAVERANAARTAFLANAYLGARADALDELMPLARRVQAEYDALKAARSVLDNDDLLTRAYDALRRNPGVRAEFSGKFKMIMVDEFQDTAQQQVELVRLLCSPDGHELCTVGDAQQSIYRFRGADVSVFRNKKREVEHAGTVCDLDVNYRSHADILSFADRIFEGGASNRLGRDFLHLESCGEDRRRGARVLACADTSRRQAILAVGGSSDDRAACKAAAIAERFQRLRDTEGFSPSDMVILMTKLTKADAYADALRARGIPCIVSGGTSVFRRAPEVGVIRSLLAFLANPDDGDLGLKPLLASPMFGLGAQELLALATQFDGELGIADSRSLTGDTFLSGTLMEAFGELPVLARARDVLARALARVGRDPMPAIVRDAVNESGWLYRLQRGGATERAQAANILKALAIVDAESSGQEFAPRLVARAFAAHIDRVKESPAALNGASEDAVRIMTVHASKGLEFPVVAVAECDGVRPSADRFQTVDRGPRMLWTAFPNRFELASDKELLEAPDLDDEREGDVPGSAAEAFAYMRRESAGLDYEEAARLLYVALTRAREVAILAMGARFGTELLPGHASSLVGEVLARILPADEGNGGLPDLGPDHLDFPDAHAGDFQLMLLDDLKFPGGRAKISRAYGACDYPAAREGGGCEPGAAAVREEDGCAGERSFPLVTPADISYRVEAAPREARDAYSYTSLAAALHAEGEDRAPSAAGADDAGAEAELAARQPGDGLGAVAPDGRHDPSVGTDDGDPTALGSAFHAAAQWMVEMGCDAVPSERLDALCRVWSCTQTQRIRLEEALDRWRHSAIRAEALAWPSVRAEVPFFTHGSEALFAHGAYAEGAIDLLCTDPDDKSRALVIDYKTGGHADEDPGRLREKHRLQAGVYADVLHKAGYGSVSLRFVRVEQDDRDHPGQPQVVSYEL